MKCFLFCLLLFLNFSNIFSIEILVDSGFNPPDSSTKILDKSSAVFSIDEGKKLFNSGKTREALLKFRIAATKDPNNWKATYWISASHVKLNNFDFALQYGLQTLALNSNPEPDIYEVIGRSLHQLGKLDSALLFYQKAIEKMPKTSSKELRIQHKIKECNYAKEELSKSLKSRRKLIQGEVNSGFNDYAPVLSSDGKTLFFTGRRNNTTGGLSNPDDEQYFEDIYQAKWNEELKIWDSVSNDLGRINGLGFDALTHLSKDGFFAYLTINNTVPGLPNQTKSSDIFEIDYNKKGKWNAPRIINNKTINTSFYDGLATLTEDGNTMYFVSDRKGEKSLTDIYVVHKVGKVWGEAKPVSDSINTIGRETTPYITPDGRYLFFSSDGHLGMGGYDVYVSENLGSTWSKPINLGSEINTVNDDTHFRYYPDLKKAFMAGFTIKNQKGSVSIFEVNVEDFKIPSVK
jgi:tetratricopeptide (TPR) repeat protein